MKGKIFTVRKPLQWMPRIQHLLISGWGLRWQKVAVVLFTVYLDDSGTDPYQHVAIATALIIPAQRIVAMEREWAKFKGKEGFAAFHMAAFVAKNAKEGFNWDDARQERVYKRVKQITRKYGVKAFSFAVWKQDYDEIVTDQWREHFGKDHYVWALRHVMKFLDDWRLDRNTPPLAYIFDWMGGPGNARQRAVRTVMEQAESLAIEAGRAGDYTGYNFQHKKDFAGLQCVDPIAWSCYQIALEQFKGTPCKRFAKSTFLEYVAEPKFLDCRFVTRENLKDWFEHEQEHPKSIELFNKWSGKKNAGSIGP